MNMKTFAISQELADKIIRYLATKPMIEVEEMVNGIRMLKEIKTEEETNQNTEQNEG